MGQAQPVGMTIDVFLRLKLDTAPCLLIQAWRVYGKSRAQYARAYRGHVMLSVRNGRT